MPTENAVELKWIFAVMRRWLWLVVGCTALAALMAFAVESRMTPAYAASITLLVDPAEHAAASAYNDLMAGERLALTYSEMLKGQRVLEAAIARLGLHDAPETLAKKIVVEPVSGTQLIRLMVTDSLPERAAQLANAVADEFSTQTKELQAERYRGSLAGIQAKMDDLVTQTEETQTTVDDLNAAKIEDQKELLRLQSQLEEKRVRYSSLQQTYQDLQRTALQIQDQVRIAQAAEVPAGATTSSYTATVMLLVDQAAVTGQGGNSAVLDSERLAATYRQLLAARPALKSAIAESGLRAWPDDLNQSVSVQPVLGTQLIQLGVEDTDAARAASVANALAASLVKQLQTLLLQPYDSRMADTQTSIDALAEQIDDAETKIGLLTGAQMQRDTQLTQLTSLLTQFRSDYRAAQSDYDQLRVGTQSSADTITITESAHVPQKPAKSTLLYTSLAMLIGALLALGCAFLVEYMDESIRTPEHVSQILALRTLVTIGHLSPKGKPMIVGRESHSVASEAFLALAANIRGANAEKPLRTLLVTSSTPKEGKSVVAANLATALARTGLRIVVVDGNLRRPRLHWLFDLDRTRGLTDALRTGSAEQYLQYTGEQGLRVLPTGELPVNPAAVLGSPDLAKLLGDLGRDVDLLLIDCPSVLGLADTQMLAALADGVLLVVRSAHTSARDALAAVEILRQTETQLIGVVLNVVKGRGDRYARYYQRSDTAAGRRPVRMLKTPAPQKRARGGQTVSALSHPSWHGYTAQEMREQKLRLKDS